MAHEQIDFVISWVNGSDPKWQKKHNDFVIGQKNNSGNDVSRFEDYETMRYWFRAVEKYTPWVHKVYLITDHQTPDWINKKNPKIVCINHEDYIPKKFLPTFNSNVIELCITRIKELADKFVLFNDDLFINKRLSPEYFFKEGLPVDVGFFRPITPVGDFDHIILNDVELINEIFNKRDVERKNFCKYHSIKYTPKQLLQSYLSVPYPNFIGFYDSHSATPYRKDFFQEACYLFSESIGKTLWHKTRTNEDVSHWLIRYYQIAKGNFIPQKGAQSEFYTLDQIKKIKEDLKSNKHSIICVNDPEEIDSLQYFSELQLALKEKFPRKSSFEK